MLAETPDRLDDGVQRLYRRYPADGNDLRRALVERPHGPRKRIRINTMTHDSNLRTSESDTALGRCGDLLDERRRKAKRECALPMHVPKNNPLPPQAPQESAEQHIFRIHVNEHGIVLISILPYKEVKTYHV